MPVVNTPYLHADQLRARDLKEDGRGAEWTENAGGRFKVVRAGRRWGKSMLGEAWIARGAAKLGAPCGWFAPDYKKLTEVYEDLRVMLEPIIERSSKTDGVIRLVTGGRIDFWTLENESAGRSRKYKRVFLDEVAFTKPNMMHIWKSSIKPTLFDFSGSCWAGSNTNGIADDNFMWQICNQAEHGFIEFHAPTINNPTIPERLPGESVEEQTARRVAEIEELRRREHPLVFRQEYEAEFINWDGVAFFTADKWLINDAPVPAPTKCDFVFAVIDTATKTGTANDGTAVTYFARTKHFGFPLVILDWEITQIEGSLLEIWLPSVLENLEAMARSCGARAGSFGVWIEDKASGEILNQIAARKQLKAHKIDTRLTALGKDERALSVSGTHYRGECKISETAYNKTTVYKKASRNHFMTQVTGFHIGDKDNSKRADDLLDTYCYGLALALGDGEGF